MREVLAAPGWQLPRLPVGEMLDQGWDWLRRTFGGFFAGLDELADTAVNAVTAALTAAPPLALVVVFAALALWLSGWHLALFALLGFALIVSMGATEATMRTLSQVLVSGAVAVLLAVPIGIVAGRNDRVSRVLGPLLRALHAVPPLVYLVPVALLLGVGPAAGMLAAVLVALPSGIRLTEQGIRGVDREIVEMGAAFGSSPTRILTGIQLPLATGSILAAVNRIVLLALSVVVLAGVFDAPGLGRALAESVTDGRPAAGFEAAIAVAVLAVFLDRLTVARRLRLRRWHRGDVPESTTQAHVPSY